MQPSLDERITTLEARVRALGDTVSEDLVQVMKDIVEAEERLRARVERLEHALHAAPPEE